VTSTLGPNTLALLQQYLNENYPHDAFSSAARVAEVLALVDSPWVGAVWDSHHPYRPARGGVHAIPRVRRGDANMAAWPWPEILKIR
jgi:hypothetical protein